MHQGLRQQPCANMYGAGYRDGQSNTSALAAGKSAISHTSNP